MNGGTNNNGPDCSGPVGQTRYREPVSYFFFLAAAFFFGAAFFLVANFIV
jgi:hypothetical protein